jgi:hypothetical protein
MSPAGLFPQKSYSGSRFPVIMIVAVCAVKERKKEREKKEMGREKSREKGAGEREMGRGRWGEGDGEREMGRGRWEEGDEKMET